MSSSNSPSERLVTKRELAVRLRVTTRSLDKWIAAGKVMKPTLRISRKAVYWTESDVSTIIQSLKEATARKAG